MVHKCLRSFTAAAGWEAWSGPLTSAYVGRDTVASGWQPQSLAPGGRPYLFLTSGGELSFYSWQPQEMLKRMVVYQTAFRQVNETLGSRVSGSPVYLILPHPSHTMPDSSSSTLDPGSFKVAQVPSSGKPQASTGSPSDPKKGTHGFSELKH